MILNQIRNVRSPFLRLFLSLLLRSHSPICSCATPAQCTTSGSCSAYSEPKRHRGRPLILLPLPLHSSNKANSQGCMNALANYLILQSNSPSTDKFKATRQREEARKLFGRLEVVDPDRKERYRDMAEGC
jgi:hypothetical protein